MRFAATICVLLFAACTDTGPSQEDTLPFEEPALTPDEQALLPDGLAPDPEHGADVLVDSADPGDPSVFDDDVAEHLYDDDVTEDAIRTTPESLLDEAPIVPTVIYSQPLLHSGLHPRASDGLRAAGVTAGRIVQTIGNASASAGYHLADGSVNGHAYTAAVDLSVSGLSSTQIHNLLERLAKAGFAGWYRQNGHDGWAGANHIHAVYANCKMKAQLRAQVRSWLAGRNGLVSNTLYKFHTFSATAKHVVKGKFEQSHQGTSNGGGGASGRVNANGGLVAHAQPNRSSAVTGSLADGAFFTITCQTHGQSVAGAYGTTTVWDKTSAGYVTDAYVYTGSDGLIAPLCP